MLPDIHVRRIKYPGSLKSRNIQDMFWSLVLHFRVLFGLIVQKTQPHLFLFDFTGDDSDQFIIQKLILSFNIYF